LALADATHLLTSARPDPSSFRDWDGRVFVADGRVLRGLTARGLSDWEALATSRVFEDFTSSGEIVETRSATAAEVDAVHAADPSVRWAGVLSHERVPFVSYPFEWPFSMLQDAALLQLRLTSAALGEGLMLKDATPYNVQWRGSAPVFIDIGSFERARPSEPWAGYRQFCMLYLFPLLLEAYRGIAFQPWLRAQIDGIAPSDMRSFVSRRDALRRGVFRHVFLHASLERRHGERNADLRKELSAAGFDSRMVDANLRHLTKLVAALRTNAGGGAWGDYRTTCSYGERDAAEKEDFVRRVVGRSKRHMTWDLGCNDGRFALLAADHSDVTIAADSDPCVVDSLYRARREAGDRRLLPLVLDLASPSPGIGWRNRERSPFMDRGRPDLVLCLAVVHHLSISHNVPLREIVDWLRSLDCEVVVEFPDRDDSMVQALLLRKPPASHPDYRREHFESLLFEAFEVVESRELSSRTRTLYLVRPP
jgi:hypothetical protein